ncbi:MAG: PEGA domain-containing protein [Labilithrix sp.]|nr:PEGA domain-containing protein [Labilithrix sp.]MCW5811846.1 PEGA domain-containing protein [Labilithrix sp.]
MRLLRSLFVLAAVVLLARAAHAGDVEKARRLFADGVRLYQTGDYEGAKRLFKEADAEHHAPAIIYNVGLAEEKLGHRQAALDAYEAYVAEVGDRGELSAAAVAAVAQIRSTSTKLRIESKPPGARVFLDGMPLPEATPTTYLVGAGHHVIVAQGEGWRAERDLEAKGGGESLTVALEEPPRVTAAPATGEPPPSPPAIAPAPIDDVSPPKRPAPVEIGAPDALVWGAAFAIAPALMLGVPQDAGGTKTNTRDIVTVLAGPLLEIGYAITEDIEFLGRGLAGIGPDAKPSAMYMGGPGLSFRLADRLWLGATFIGGRIDSARKGVPYGTNLVFGVIAEANLAVIKKPHGEWIVGVQPSFLLTEMRNDNTTLFVPLSFGYRGY